MPEDAPQSLVEDLRAATRIAIDATLGVTDVVEEMHVALAGGRGPVGRAVRALTAPLYAAARVVTGWVGAALDFAIVEVVPRLGPNAPAPEAAALRAALNGVLGDTLAATGSALAIPMRLRLDGIALPLTRDGLRAAYPSASPRVLVLVHGSCMSDRSWARRGRDHGAQLDRDLGTSRVYVHYNTGLHVSHNGRELAAALQALVDAWPVPVAEIALVGHSMGGLVARAAVHAADDAGLGWRRALRSMVFLGTPHHGAHLERLGNWFEVALGAASVSAPLARLARLRSAGVTDLRYGSVLDAHWEGRDRFAFHPDPRETVQLPADVACFAIAGLLRGRFGTDGIVSVRSALGQHRAPGRTLAFPEGHRWVCRGAGHLDLLSRPDVYEQIRRWLAEDPRARLEDRTLGG